MISDSFPLRLGWLALLLLLVGVTVWSTATPVTASPSNDTYQTLPFSQDWSNTNLITTNDDWTNVPGILGYRGDDLAVTDGVDPQIIVAEGLTILDVNANQTNPNTFSTGGVTEFHIADPTVALAGSGTADAPFILIHVNTTNQFDVQICYNLRDIDGSTDNAIQRIALQYRIGESGDFTNLPAGYVPDATTGPSQATLVTPVSVTLPDATDNKPKIQLRIITTNANGNDEWVGVDDIRIGGNGDCSGTTTPTATSANSPTPTLTPTSTHTPTPSHTPTVTNTPTTAPVCGSTATLIHTIQGSGTASPLDGLVVTIEGVVTARFAGLSGFYVQEEDADVDANPATSEGIFVFDSDAPPSVAVGAVVRLTGTVDEFSNLSSGGGGYYRDLTEITSVNTAGILICGTASLPTPVLVTLPEATDRSFEAYEGMLVTVTDGSGGPLTVSQNFFQGPYGQVTVSSGGRMYNATNGNGLGDTLEYNARRWIILDDGSSQQNPNPIPFIDRSGTPPQDYTLRVGDTLTSITGVIDQGRLNSGDATAPDDYRIHPTQPVVITRVNHRTTAPEPVGGAVRVASFNVLNYFNGNGMGGGFPTPRGANNLAEFTRQRNKIIPALVALNADVVGLMEIENDNNDPILTNRAIQDLVDGLNAVMGSNTYAFALEPSPGTDEIKVAMLYKPAVVQPQGNALNYQTTHPTYGNVFDRPPLAVLFEHNLTGERFVVVVNHFKSKSSCPASGPDIDTGDGQGCWNVKRVAQANALAAWIQNTLIQNYDADVMVIGDLNAYGAEDPINALTASGFINNVATWVPAVQRYSYIFDGAAGYLDHAISTPSFSDQITGATIWHINTDEPSVIDYNTENKPEDLYSPTPYRSSDHDPVLVGVSLRAADYSDSPASFGVAWHAAPHTLYLGAGVTDDDTAGDNDDNPTDDGVAVIQNRVEVMVSGPGGAQGWLSGWADLNNDGVFAANERIVNQLVTVGSNTIPLSPPLPTSSLRFRFRLYESSVEPFAPDAALPVGGASGGEVEDFTRTPLAVTLAEFVAIPVAGGIDVRWETVSEVGTVGYHLWRSTTPNSPADRINTEMIPAQAPGGGGATYTWLDENVHQGETYYYWLESVEADGNTALYGPVSATMLPPTAVNINTLTATSSPVPVLWLAGLILMGLVGLWYRSVR